MSCRPANRLLMLNRLLLIVQGYYSCRNTDTIISIQIQIYANTKTNRLLNCLHFLVEGWISQMQGPAWCDALWCMCSILHPHCPAFLKDQHNHLYHQHHQPHHHWNINPWSTLKTSLSMIWLSNCDSDTDEEEYNAGRNFGWLLSWFDYGILHLVTNYPPSSFDRPPSSSNWP